MVKAKLSLTKNSGAGKIDSYAKEVLLTLKLGVLIDKQLHSLLIHHG